MKRETAETLSSYEDPRQPEQSRRRPRPYVLERDEDGRVQRRGRAQWRRDRTNHGPTEYQQHSYANILPIELYLYNPWRDRALRLFNFTGFGIGFPCVCVVISLWAVRALTLSDFYYYYYGRLLAACQS